MNRSRTLRAWGLYCALLAAAPARSETTVGPTKSTVLILSDIHFDPFDDDALVPRLAAAPPAQWSAILAADSRMPVEGRDDTTYPLLTSAISAMRKAAPDPRFVVITGDFLAHDFRSRFDRTAAGKIVSYEDFVDRTLAFLALELGGAFPDAQFVPVVGNNDSYCGDYASSKNSPFLAHMAGAWAPLVNRGAKTTFLETFPGMGHYSADARGTPVRLLVVNSVFWSRKFVPFKNECGATGAHPGEDELTWLDQELAKEPGRPTWILTHIPPGMDAFGSASKDKALLSYSEESEKGILVVLEKYGPRIPLFLAGHTHMGAFRIQHDHAGTTDVPVLVSPAISPLFGNDPAFRVATIADATGRVADYTEYALHGAAGVAPAWQATYRFSDIAGAELTPAAVVQLQQKMESTSFRNDLEADYSSDPGVRAKIEKSWRVYACAMTSATVAPFETCMKTLVQH